MADPLGTQASETPKRRLPPGVRWILGCGSALVLLTGSVAGLAWFALGGPHHVSEHWPNGSTPRIRAAAEELLPPPLSAVWEDVHRWGGDKIEFYRECLSYHTQDPPGTIRDHYAELLRERGGEVEPPTWMQHTYFYTVASRAGEAARGWDPHVWLTTFAEDVKGGQPYRYQLCSSSWERAAAGAPPIRDDAVRYIE
jgi:hypothetical protein